LNGLRDVFVPAFVHGLSENGFIDGQNVAIGSVVPADNAGLGLARSVSVVSVLRQSNLLAGYKLIPLSGAQLVNTDETLALAGMPGDIRERRRIEIRLRKSSPHDAPIQQEVTANIPEVPLPKPRPMLMSKPKPRPIPQAMLFNGPVSLAHPSDGNFPTRKLNP
jgi:hypothetical protein